MGHAEIVKRGIYLRKKGLKHCGTCNTIKFRMDFYFRYKDKDILCTQCKTCSKYRRPGRPLKGHQNGAEHWNWQGGITPKNLSLIHISEPTRPY